MAWLCTCGNGELDTFGHEALPPEFCEVCDFALWEHFQYQEECAIED